MQISYLKMKQNPDAQHLEARLDDSPINNEIISLEDQKVLVKIVFTAIQMYAQYRIGNNKSGCVRYFLEKGVRTALLSSSPSAKLTIGSIEDQKIESHAEIFLRAKVDSGASGFLTDFERPLKIENIEIDGIFVPDAIDHLNFNSYTKVLSDGTFIIQDENGKNFIVAGTIEYMGFTFPSPYKLEISDKSLNAALAMTNYEKGATHPPIDTKKK